MLHNMLYLFLYVIMHGMHSHRVKRLSQQKKLLGCLSQQFLISHHNHFVATTTKHFSVAIVYHHSSIFWCDNQLLWNKPTHHLIIVTVPFGVYCYGKNVVLSHLCCSEYICKSFVNGLVVFLQYQPIFPNNSFYTTNSLSMLRWWHYRTVFNALCNKWVPPSVIKCLKDSNLSTPFLPVCYVHLKNRNFLIVMLLVMGIGKFRYAYTKLCQTLILKVELSIALWLMHVALICF